MAVIKFSRMIDQDYHNCDRIIDSFNNHYAVLYILALVLTYFMNFLYALNMKMQQYKMN
jgi:hypothetical protein